MKKKPIMVLLLIMVMLIAASCSESEPVSDNSREPVLSEETPEQPVEEAVQTEDEEEVNIGPYPGYKAIDFTLKDHDEKTYALSDYEGKPVLLIYWVSS